MGAPRTEYDAIVVGAGFAGMYMLHRLRGLGLSVRVFETGSGVGGTWYWNRYPGARVDGPSMQYSYSFSPELEQEWHWNEHFAPQAELEKYANHVADRFDLRRDIQFETTVTRASYDEAARRWTIATSRGDTVSAKYFICASGCLSATNVPAFKGVESFRGQWYHTSRWPKEGVDLTGKRVGIIGTGSTGIQAIPELAKQCKHLFVFQRTANFSLPSDNRPMTPEFEQDWKRRYAEHREKARNSWFGSVFFIPAERSALSVSPEERNRAYEAAWGKYAGVVIAFNDVVSNREANDTAAEFVRNKIRAIVRDPKVAELLAPKDHPIATKRLCIDSGYYETYNRDNVTLVDVRTHPIEEITPAGLRTTAGSYGVDVLVFATGFDAMTGPLFRMNITGRGGLSLKDKWHAGPRAYLGLQTAGFPNMFMITGPGSPSVLANMMLAVEQHADWIAETIRHLRSNGLDSIEATQEAEDGWVEHVNQAADKTLHKHANSWYLGANIPGKPRVFMPYTAGFGVYRKECEAIVAANYRGFALERGGG
jgi:cation diffusion facilitator CzcD-associated flavoprotein CzcO